MPSALQADVLVGSAPDEKSTFGVARDRCDDVPSFRQRFEFAEPCRSDRVGLDEGKQPRILKRGGSVTDARQGRFDA
jgi:hypothetical protein